MTTKNTFNFCKTTIWCVYNCSFLYLKSPNSVFGFPASKVHVFHWMLYALAITKSPLHPIPRKYNLYHTLQIRFDRLLGNHPAGRHYVRAYPSRLLMESTEREIEMRNKMKRGSLFEKASLAHALSLITPYQRLSKGRANTRIQPYG